MTTQEHHEPLLYWLQEFYATKIAPLKCRIGNSEIRPLLPEFISDEQIKDGYWYFKKVPDMPGLVKIYTKNDPGWSLKFGFYGIKFAPQTFASTSINVKESIEKLEDYNWFHCHKNGYLFDIECGPLNLALGLLAFNSYINRNPFHVANMDEANEKLLLCSNSLLRWLEDFYLDCCEVIENWQDDEPTFRYESCINMSLISTSYGWVMVWDLSDIINGDNPFEPIFIEEEDGTIECYKTDEDLLIIRTHFRGLIKGLTIFKEWAEANLI